MHRLAKNTLFAASLFSFLSSAALATNLFDNGAANTLNTASEDVSVADSTGGMPTTLTIADGAVIATVPDEDLSILVSGSSILNFEGGEAAGTLTANDSAVVTVSGGQIGEDLEVNGGVFTLSGTGRVDDDVRFAGGTFTMNDGGEVNDQFFVTGSANLTLGATAGPINDDLFIRDTANLNMAGATLGDELFVQGDATANITGGYVDDDLNANDNAVINVSFLEVDDSVDASGNGLVNFSAGIVNGGFEAVGSSIINVSGGTFENILSDGEVVLAGGGTINISGGTFGTAGVDDGGAIGSSLGGTLNLTGATVAGVAEGTAPTATINAVLNGETNVSNVAFGDLVLEAANSGTLTADDFTANGVAANALSGGVVIIEGGDADSLTIATDLGGDVLLTGGSFDEISAGLVGAGSSLTIIGDEFTYNGTPIADVDALLGDSGAFIEETGELRTVSGTIAGVLADGSDFSISFNREFVPVPGAQVFLQAVPEPNGQLLLVMASLALLAVRRRK